MAFSCILCFTLRDLWRDIGCTGFLYCSGWNDGDIGLWGARNFGTFGVNLWRGLESIAISFNQNTLFWEGNYTSGHILIYITLSELWRCGKCLFRVGQS